MTDNTAALRRLKTELEAKRQLQENLLEKYLMNDHNIMPVFDKLSRKYQDEIMLLESQLTDAEADAEKVTFDELLAFSNSLLVDVSTAWKMANIDQKQKVQNILFPAGLFYHPENGILNSENDCLFNKLEDLVSGNISMARPERFELPT